MKQETKCMKLICDGCGENFETGEGFVCYTDDPDGSLIWSDAAASGWIELGGNHYCPCCYQIDDDDNIITKDGRKFDGNTHEEIEDMNPQHPTKCVGIEI